MRRNSLFSHGMPPLSLSYVIGVVGASLIWLSCLSSPCLAQAPITSSGLNSVISDPIAMGSSTQYNITGGTRPGGGANLFHSFGNFNVPTNNIANFLNAGSVDLNGTLLPPNLPTSNILGRVTGGNPSSIFGTIQTSGFSSANLFLMNPAGIVFGPNATLNVGGSVKFTTADYLKLADGVLFNAIPNAAADALLSAAPVAVFGFLGSDPGAITVQGSQLNIAEGQGLSLIGGSITIESGTLPDATVQPAQIVAPGGQINLASVASPGEILAGTLEQVPNINGQSFGSLGTIQISPQSLLDVGGNGGGIVRIRGGRFVLDESLIFANVTGPGPVTNEVETLGDGVDIQVSQDTVIQNGALIETSVVGNATPGVTYGGVHIKADRIEVLGIADLNTGNFVPTIIQSNVAQGSTGGNSGNIKLEANSILIKDLVFLETQTRGSGNSGNIILKSIGNLEADGLVFVMTGTGAFASGNAGNIELTSTQGGILLTNAPFVSSQSGAFSGGSVGSITVNAPNGDILMTGSPDFGPAVIFTHIDGTGTNTGNGGIQLTAQNLAIENSGIQIDNFTPFQPGSLTANLTGSLSMSGGDIFPSTLLTTTRRSARSADLNITAHDILLTDGSLVATETFRSGDAGTLNVFTQTLEIRNGAQLRSSSRFNPFPPPGQPPEIPSGAGGSITIQGLASPAESLLIDGPGSGIFTNTEGSGTGGNINLHTKFLTLKDGGILSAATSGASETAVGGTITATAGQDISLLQNGRITVESSGGADAGGINLTAGRDITLKKSTISAEAKDAGGGNIKLTAPNVIRLVDSTISTSVEGGVGGNLEIDPKSVVLQNSKLIAQAVQGQGGNISIVTESFLSDPGSLVDASSQFGVSGTVTIQSPINNVSETLAQLPESAMEVEALLQQRCAAQAAGGQFSTFLHTRAEGLSVGPGSWSPSSLVGSSFNRLSTARQGAGSSTPLDVAKIGAHPIPIMASATDSVSCGL